MAAARYPHRFADARCRAADRHPSGGATTRPGRGLGGGAGLFDVVANALYLGATQHGLLSIVAPVASLYPAATVLLALAIERERVRPVQLAGLGLAATALVLVAT